jgi:hypothetical protein
MNMEIEQPPLPPADTGKATWLMLAGCTLIQAPAGVYQLYKKELYQLVNSVTGFPIVFGVFQEYSSSHPESLKDDTANVAVIGTTMTVFSLIFSPRATVQDSVLKIGWQTEQYPVG